ncbi:hypothetical protein PR003_g14818 [Phytophthora rubi]|uniref:Uncharacterized protein n=1 Tax=Phytophthora rubi TaxID=129364 RepID=A0A6A3L503_9STRA|nr:hypothetical protein PR002_g14623 [Phytophthora rubi]KAE9028007.1 hypothetical protein PR001_g11832 [Phytophthora rubi]KAE9331833.1 hypothetical protein PR003_g14818 [Phytophthora rubi]
MGQEKRAQTERERQRRQEMEREPCDEKRVFSTFFHTRQLRVWSESSAQRRSGRRRLAVGTRVERVVRAEARRHRRLAAGLGRGGRTHLLRGARRFLLCRLFTTAVMMPPP